MQYNVASAAFGIATVQSSNIIYSDRLDHLRFFAALSVLSFHTLHTIYRLLHNASAPLNFPTNPLSVFFIEGHTAVGLFLTLSGFLFARICMNKQVDVKQFYVNRLLRIFPLYLSALVFSMCVAPSSIEAFLTSLLTFQVLPGAIHGNYTDHLWSIGVEMQFYVLFPILLISYRKKGLNYLWQVVAFCLLLNLAVQLSTGASRDVVYATILGRLNQAILGMIFGFSFERIRKYASNPFALLGSITAMSLALQWFHNCGGMPGTAQNPLWVFWLSLEALLWALVICSYESCSLKIPEKISRAIAYLGSMSYSIYVMHYFLACALCSWFVKQLQATHHNSIVVSVQQFLLSYPGETSFWAGIYLILPATVLLSFFSYNVIERPFMDLRRQYTRPLAPSASDDEPQLKSKIEIAWH